MTRSKLGRRSCSSPWGGEGLLAYAGGTWAGRGWRMSKLSVCASRMPRQMGEVGWVPDSNKLHREVAQLAINWKDILARI